MCIGSYMRLKCTNKYCNYEWDYKGNSKFYACCPRCRYSVHVWKNAMLDPNELKNWDEL